MQLLTLLTIDLCFQCIGSGVVLPVATILYLKAMTEKTINGFGEVRIEERYIEIER